MGYPLHRVSHHQWEQQVETSEDKTKRKFANYLLVPIWNYQYSVFYEAPEDSTNPVSYTHLTLPTNREV